MPLISRTLLALCIGLGLMGSTMHALDGGFTATLTSEQLQVAGLTNLTADERAFLDRLVAAESAPGREIYSAINGNFARRQTAEDRRQAGLDRLSAEQLAQLNNFVATALVPRPKPKERPRIKDSEVLNVKPPAEIHGAITLGMGWGGGGTARYGALQLEYYDPAHGLSLGIGLDSYSGPGRYGYFPYHAQPAFSGASGENFPESGRPIWATGGYPRRNDFITPPGIQQYLGPAATPAEK